MKLPDLNKLPQIDDRKKFIAFSQNMYMYKLNLQNLEESNGLVLELQRRRILVVCKN